MKFDENLIRELLLMMEQKEDISSTTEILLPLDKVALSEDEAALSPEALKKRQEQICWFHIRLLLKEGYLKGTFSEDDTTVYVEHLTWQGHELLDSIRDNSMWEKLRRICTKKAMPAMLSEFISKGAEITAQQLRKIHGNQ